jgi:hypothetical protein
MGNVDSRQRDTEGNDVPISGNAANENMYPEISSFEAHQIDDEGRKRTKGKRRTKSREQAVQSRDDEGGTNKIGIPDDQVHVNLAMSDLMAYLQVVANNSSNLPQTRRDDPEIERALSTLTPEDYMRKSAAFVPADVRIIGGTFTRYGRVWDLPTSEVRCYGA